MKTEKENSQFLTESRFQFTRSRTIEELKRLEGSKEVDKKDIEKINDEDILILIKYKTYKKSIRNLIISLLLICLSLLFQGYYFLAILGVLFGISSLSGMRFNSLSKQKKRYILS